MNDGLKIALVGIGGYFLYEYLFAAPVASTVPVSTTGVVATPPVPVSATSSSQIAQFAANNSLMTVSQWNYYANQTNPGKVPIILGGVGDNNVPVTYAQYQGYFGSPGAIVGVQPGVSGLGAIVNLVNMFKGTKLGSGFGEEEFLSNGLGTLVDDALMSAGYIDEGPMVEAASWNGSASDLSTADFYLAAEGQGT